MGWRGGREPGDIVKERVDWAVRGYSLLRAWILIKSSRGPEFPGKGLLGSWELDALAVTTRLRRKNRERFAMWRKHKSFYGS